MPNCIFCKIVRKELSSHIVYEDDNFLGFLDIHPDSPGHTQLIPKAHYRWVWDVPNIGQYYEIAQKIALAQKKAFNQELIVSKVVGDEVPHAHVWIMPRRETAGDKMDFEGNRKKIVESL